MPRFGEERDSCKFFGGCEHVSLPGHQGPTERGIKKILLHQFPRHDFPDVRSYNTGLAFENAAMKPGHSLLRRRRAYREAGHGRLAFLDRRRRPLSVQAGYETVFHLMGITQDIALIEFQDAGEIVYSGYIAVHQPGFDHMFPFPAEKFLIENLLQRRWSNLHRSLQSLPVRVIRD